MTAAGAIDTEREQRIERIAADLLPRASQFTRLVLRRLADGMSRTEGGMLRTLSESPRRITELAELEGLAQPTATLLVKRLEERGWVSRARDADDGRVALISLTGAGRDALAEFRRRYRAALAVQLQAMSDAELGELDAATATLGRIVDELGRGGAR
jgi:DNA-binding MarR family transcriptional regulator